MIILIGLGNPGTEYEKNRHNVGFMFAEYVAEQQGASTFKFDKYLMAETASVQSVPFAHGSAPLLIAKPQTFMNRSGEAVKKIMTKYESSVSELIVAHDDLDITIGKFKLSKGTGPKLHNGLESIENFVKSTDFWRVRIGVDNRSPERRIPGEAYVLQNFESSERSTLNMIFPSILERLMKEVL